MNLQSILFPTDFSKCADTALTLAASLAAESGAMLHIVHVDDLHALDVPLAIAGPHGSGPELWDRSTIRQRLKRIVPPRSDVRFTHDYLEGLPIDEIVKFAGRQKVDLIVMASHGRTGLSRLLMGSVAEGVMRKAPCAVLVVKQHACEIQPETGAESNAPSSKSGRPSVANL